jgi:hypothetical protein
MLTSRSSCLVVACVSLVLLGLCPRGACGGDILVPAGSTWRYLDDGSDQGIVWHEFDFPDGTWNSGPAQLGYGDGDEATTVSYGSDPNDKHITTYFRHSFSVADASLYTMLLVKLLRDDGAVAYLNGHEIVRSNMPSGPIDSSTVASSTVGGDDEDAFFEYYVDSDSLRTGTNVLAVEIHQRSGTSSDISFALELIGVEEIAHPMRKAPYLLYTGINTEMTVLWQLVYPDTCRIDWGTDTSYSIGSQGTLGYGDDHQHTYTICGLTPSEIYFYRVIAEQDTVTGSFRAAPQASETEVKFFAYGDTRTYPADHDQVAAAMISAYTTDPDLQTMLICAGDLITNGNQEDDWDDEFFDPSYANIQEMLANLPYQTARGNHEGSGPLFRKYFPYQYVSPHYWSFDYGPAHFTVIDQYIDYTPGSAQYTWIVNDLSTTTKTWKFLLFHAPGWSAGGGHSNDSDVQTHIQPLCITHGVSIVFAGHNHYYSRAVVNGIQHITTGGGGAPLRTPDPGYPNIVVAEEEYHFCAVEIDGGFLSFAAISAAGDTLDQFTLTDPTVGVEAPVRARLYLAQNTPNPFSGSTTIAFALTEPADVTLCVYDAEGRRVKVLADGRRGPGLHREIWDGRNGVGRRMPSGVYFYELQVPGHDSVRKMMLAR